jgi:hypothetical protein
MDQWRSVLWLVDLERFYCTLSSLFQYDLLFIQCILRFVLYLENFSMRLSEYGCNINHNLNNYLPYGRNYQYTIGFLLYLGYWNNYANIIFRVGVIFGDCGVIRTHICDGRHFKSCSYIHILKLRKKPTTKKYVQRQIPRSHYDKVNFLSVVSLIKPQ